MAQPILLKIPPEDPREVLRHRLENAPLDHAEAVLALFDVVQELHDKGLLEIAKGALGSGEKVMKIAVDTANSPEIIRSIRNLMILGNLLASIDPEVLEHVKKAVPEAMEKARKDNPPGLFSLLGMLASRDMRRLLGVATSVAQSVGRGLGKQDPK
jgi:uncharacterized protein YjgD (DUF1641 family)